MNPRELLQLSVAGFAMLLLTAGTGRAAEAPVQRMIFDRPQIPVPLPAVKGPRVGLTIQEAVSLALARNFDITIEAHNPRIRETEVTQQEAVFDPALFAEGTTTRSELDSNSRFFAGGQNSLSTQNVSAGLAKKFITGADVSLTFETIRTTSNSGNVLFAPSHEPTTTLSITQPLLKNFGIDVNEANIRLAGVTRGQSLQSYRGRILEVVDQVQQSYYDLVFAMANLEFRRKAVDLARDLLRRNRIQVEVGTLAPIEITEAEATVASREVDLIAAERDVQEKEDALKKLLNITSDLPSWSIQLVPSEKVAYAPVRLDEMALALDALRKRSDLENSRAEIEKRKIELARARQNLLPQFDAIASAGNQGLKGTFGDAIDRMSGNKGYSLTGGLSFRYPLGNRDAEANLEKSRLQLSQAGASFDQLEQTILEEVRRSVRRVRSDEKRVEATQVARRLAEERLAATEKKFSVGLSTSRDILEDQERLANALTEETRAVVDYNKSLATLNRTTHATLERFRITLDNPSRQEFKPSK
ncbi:MAG: TolC family protein [Candidatus Tectomicrobia bacterium]|uniref:TolC family protein n=1 Tax=Tectimicrobiota bacterium TaxID=2528274 RepID=A0A932HXU7_UNCTE|nr:TolC family protein [Candidatus Tectomicrobia bacterium]